MSTHVRSTIYFWLISGSTCTELGCPGETSSCSDHGFCVKSKQSCTCYDNWQGEGCSEPKCKGDPFMCNERGNN